MPRECIGKPETGRIVVPVRANVGRAGYAVFAGNDELARSRIKVRETVVLLREGPVVLEADTEIQRQVRSNPPFIVEPPSEVVPKQVAAAIAGLACSEHGIAEQKISETKTGGGRRVGVLSE